MVQSVELLLDAAGDAAIRADWDALDGIGLRTPARHHSTATRPHLTLAVADHLPDETERAVAGLRPAFPLELVVGGLVVFGGRRLVLARGVAPTRALLDLQRAAADAVATAGSLPQTLRPDRWTPHITLARSVDAAGLARAVRVLSDRRLVTAAVGLRRWDGTARREWLLTGRAL